MSTKCPFFASGYIQSSELFIGRTYELTVIAHRMTGLQPTSINVYGPRRIGKSSLLYHFCLTWENRIEPDKRPKFAVVYASMAQVGTESEFYQALAKAWLNYPPLQKNPTWKKTWHLATWTRASFNEALKICQETVKVLPVVCVDDIETILKHSQEFDNGFYDNLRSAMGSSRLMLVIASFKPLHDYKNDYGLTSLFFNQGQGLELKRFETPEVETLLLWAERANFDKRQKKRMREWGERHPYLLQLAGVCLWEAHESGKDEQFAKQQFEADKQRNLNPTPLPRKSVIKSLFTPFQRLGQLAKKAGDWWEEFHKTVYGILIVIAVILAIVYGLLFASIKLGLIPFEFLQHILSALFSNPPAGH